MPDILPLHPPTHPSAIGSCLLVCVGESLGKAFVAVEDGGVVCGVPLDVTQEGVCTLLQQHVHHVLPATRAAYQQRRHAALVLLVHLRTCFQKRAEELYVVHRG